MANKFIALPALASTDSADGDTVAGLDLSAKREISWTLVELAKAIASRLTSATITGTLDVTGDTVRLRTAKTPASAAAAGNAGDICWDTGFIYVCTATNTWKRVAIATW
jgi:hypothetical protein